MKKSNIKEKYSPLTRLDLIDTGFQESVNLLLPTSEDVLHVVNLGDLLRYRKWLICQVNPSPPFIYTGMDCFGPFLVKRGRSVCKRYGLLLTCLCSRAVHIEMLTDMITDSFINALCCFIAIRGTVQQIRSDQGTNFMGAKNELKKALEEIDTERVTAFLSEKTV